MSKWKIIVLAVAVVALSAWTHGNPSGGNFLFGSNSSDLLLDNSSGILLAQ